MITHDEVKKLAKMAAIEIADHEIPVLARELEAVLSYASSLVAIAQSTDIVPELPKARGITRDDIVQIMDGKLLVNQSPVHEENYYVVPVVVK